MTRSPPLELCTKRLLLRRWRPSDRAPFAQLNGDPHAMRFMSSVRSTEESDAEAERLEGRFTTDGMGPWAVEVPGEASFIGFVGCWIAQPPLPFAPAVEAAWRLLPAFWGRGFAPEAARAALADVFARCQVGEIVAITTVANAPSRRVMERVGMTRDPADDFAHPKQPEAHPNRPHVLYRIGAERFRALHGASP